MPSVPGVSHRFVGARGLRFHMAEAGEGPPLVLLHGWPQHWFEWREVIGPLAERYRVLCPDLRGFGWSDAPPHGYEKEALADDVVALLDALGVERFRLIGHDWGGWIGFLIALRAPERVERLMPLNVAHPFGGPNRGRTRTMWRFWYQAVIAGRLERGGGRDLPRAVPRPGARPCLDAPLPLLPDARAPRARGRTLPAAAAHDAHAPPLRDRGQRDPAGTY